MTAAFALGALVLLAGLAAVGLAAWRFARAQPALSGVPGGLLLLAAAWILLASDPEGPRALGLGAASAASGVAVLAWSAWVTLRRHREGRLLDALVGPRSGGEWTGELTTRDGVARMRVTRVAPLGRGRLGDGQVLELRVALVPRDAWVRLRPYSPGRDRCQDRGDLDARALWLFGPAIEPIERALAAGGRVDRGELVLPSRVYATPARIEAWAALAREVVEGVRAAQSAAPDHLAARVQLPYDPEPAERARRHRAWEILSHVAPERLAALAEACREHADPLFRVRSARIRGDERVGEAVLRRSDDAAAVDAAAAWLAERGRVDLASVYAARIGVPPDAAWPALVTGLHALGGRDELPALHAVAGGEGYPAPLRAQATAAIAAIHERIGPSEPGRLALAATPALGGDIALAASTGGEVALAAPVAPARPVPPQARGKVPGDGA